MLGSNIWFKFMNLIKNNCVVCEYQRLPVTEAEVLVGYEIVEYS